MRRIKSGFTIVEILIVIAIIGILSTIGLVSFTRYQQDARDSQRSSKATILAEALEKYYDKNGEYPSCSALTGTSSTVITSVLPGVEQNTLVAPGNSSADNSIKCQELTTSSPGDYFAYVGGDTSPECLSGSACVLFTLEYRDESTGTIKSIDSRRQVSIAGVPNLTCTTVSFSQIGCQWSSVAGASTYDIQYDTNSGFTNNITPISLSSLQNNSTGLNYCSPYYFRVRAVSASGPGSWSIPSLKMTECLATPSCSLLANSISQITASWGAITNATSYTIQYDDTSDFSSLVGTYSGTALSNAATGLSTGTTYYFRVKALVSSGVSSWSNTCQVATLSPAIPPTPTNCGVTFSSFCADIPDITYATGYDFQCSGDNVTWGSGCDTGTITPSTYNFTGASSGYTYYVRAKSVNGTYSSGWSGSLITTTQSLSTPSVTATANSTSQITVSWGAIANAVSYTIQADDNSDFSSPVGTYTGVTSTSQVFTGLLPATAYYFRVQAVNGSYVSGQGTASRGTYNPTLSGAVECAGWYGGSTTGTTIQLRLNLQEVSYNIAANTSNVSWSLYRIRVSGSYGSWDQTKTWPWSVGTNGYYWSGSSNSIAFRYGLAAGTTEGISSGNINITHDSNGNATVGYSGSDGPGSSVFVSASCSGSYGLSTLR
jgi:prepilin-type N-terminal cleavage/methylation domain-containing protein